ncbi:MAG: hypothetical protein WCE62_15710 [Polyangiales bacterium]
MEALRLELLPLSIFVSNLEPGFLQTGTTGGSVYSVQDRDPFFAETHEATRQHMLQEGAKGLPLDRVVRVVDEILDANAPKLRYSVDGLVPRLALLRAMTSSWTFLTNEGRRDYRWRRPWA